MNALLKKLFIIAVAITFSTGVAYAETVRVAFAAEPYPPFTSPDASGEWVGWEIEMIGLVCAEANLECVLAPTAWDGIIPALMSKKVDMIMGSLSITEAREKMIDFSIPYFKPNAVVVGTKTEKFDPTPEGLKGKTLGVQTATTMRPTPRNTSVTPISSNTRPRTRSTRTWSPPYRRHSGRCPGGGRFYGIERRSGLL